MPHYNYKCTECETEVEVTRKISEYDKKPTTEEAPKGCDHKWRTIMKSFTKTHAPGYVGRKGSW